ncbi:MAG: hypothetical protein JXB62_07710 [Pirellulales bacterium]|nr:hypothetical protein [Pirellulales bacterium]
MIRKSVPFLVPALLLALLFAAPVRAAENALDLAPDEALAFVVVNRLAETDAKLVDLGNRLQLPLPSFLGQIKILAKIKGGLNEQGTAVLALMPPKEGEPIPIPIPVLFAPVTDFGAVVAALEPDDADAPIVQVRMMDHAFVAAGKGDYAVFTEARHRDVLQQILDAPGRARKDVAPMRSWLKRNDLAVVVTRPGVVLFSTKAREGLLQAKSSLADMPEKMKKDMEAAVAVFGVYDDALEAIEKEITTYAAGMRLGKNGALRLTDWMRVSPDGQLAKIIAEIETPEQDLLRGLPRRPFVVAGGGHLSEKTLEVMMRLSIGVIKAAPQMYGLDEQQADELAKISTRSMQGVRGMAMMIGVGKAGDPVYNDIAFVMTVDDAQAYLARYKETIEAMNRLVEGVERSILKGTKLTEIEVAGGPALQVSMEVPLAPGVEEMPGYDRMMQTFFGSGGKITAFLAAADDHTIVASYTNKRLLEQGIEVVQGTRPGLADGRRLAAAAAMLPSGAQWVGFWSPKGTVDFINRLIPALTPEGAPEFRLPECPATPPIAIAAKTVPGGVRGYMVVPAAALEAVGKMIAELKQSHIAAAAPETAPAEDH